MTVITPWNPGAGPLLLEGMKQQTRVRAGVAVAAVLGADALIHLYWSTGATWPAQGAREVSLAVLDFEVPFTPRVLLPLVALLCAGALVMLASVDRLGGLGRRIPGRVLRLGTSAIAAATLLRGLLGVVWALGYGTQTWTPFYWLNLLLYTPLCLMLFAATRAAAGAGAAKAAASPRPS
ncbi:DUF3995 domain-containing protein [Streptosporangium sp. CA-135522]|uniref:DUF3995 domain-containing protein n=1 Tax=Streptosporangium sp. CA-135522 TaxID=3240072 RepID=UPI003D9403A0